MGSEARETLNHADANSKRWTKRLEDADIAKQLPHQDPSIDDLLVNEAVGGALAAPIGEASSPQINDIQLPLHGKTMHGPKGYKSGSSAKEAMNQTSQNGLS